MNLYKFEYQDIELTRFDVLKFCLVEISRAGKDNFEGQRIYGAERITLKGRGVVELDGKHDVGDDLVL